MHPVRRVVLAVATPLLMVMVSLSVLIACSSRGVDTAGSQSATTQALGTAVPAKTDAQATTPATLDDTTARPALNVQPIRYEQEILKNGLRVIYAPLANAPVVDVRVFYHVGSKDERPDRRGFAHMFEHMMFRGSAHVAPEQHMKLVNSVGGNSNAYTSFDQTVYLNTVPASHLATVLWLEADRMASFKVSPEIYQTERNVVAEEARMRRNQPYGNLFEILAREVFTASSYRWTPIGDMDQLRQAHASELQAFFNEYYVPNNATLVIAGDFQIEQAKKLVHEDFGWIPKGESVQRTSPREPAQTQAKQVTVTDNVPLPAVVIAFKLPPYQSPDQAAISMLADILDSGASGRLDRALVNNDHPLAMQAYAINLLLEDTGFLGIGAVALAGKSTDAIQKTMDGLLEDIRVHGVTAQELDKVKQRALVGAIRGRQTAEQIGGELGEAALLTGDPERANTEIARLLAVTQADIQRVAKTYLNADQATTVIITPGQSATPSAATVPTTAAASTQVAIVEPRQVTFPADFPTTPPTATISVGRPFEKGTQIDVQGAQVVVLPDHRLPLVSWNLTVRRGSYAEEPDGQEGLAGLTTDLMQRGAAGVSYEDWSRDLESRGISLSVSDGGDYSSIQGSCTSDQLDYAIGRTQQMLRQPNLDAGEFSRLKAQTLSSLRVSQESPTSVASDELSAAIYGLKSVLGRFTTPQSVQGITLEEVRAYYRRTFVPDETVFVISGDVTVDQGRELANQLLGKWSAGTKAPKVDYDVHYAGKQKIILVDNPDGKQATVRMALPAYSLESPEKFAGSLASQILSTGIESRMNRYVRAEKGLAYTSYGVFRPNRHGGLFVAGLDTKVQSTAEAIRAAFTVLDTMRQGPVTPQELVDARQRVAGSMLMQLQTIFQQASYRMEGILNGYPVDYYDRLPERVNAVSAEQIQQVMRNYVDPNKMTIVVVAPAEAVLKELQKIGEVQVMPMPARREAATMPAD